jgi:hypothetical protein
MPSSEFEAGLYGGGAEFEGGSAEQTSVHVPLSRPSSPGVDVPFIW